MAALDLEIEIENECCICFGNLDNRSKVTLRCRHEFCLKCTLQQLKQKNDCPLCRRNVLPTNDYRSLFGEKKTEHYPRRNIMNTLMEHHTTTTGTNPYSYNNVTFYTGITGREIFSP